MYASDCKPLLLCYFSKNQYLFGKEMECPKLLGERQGSVSTRDIATLTSFQLLQNTGDGNIRFNLDAPGRYRCQVFDATGRLLQSPPISQGVNNVSLADAPKGIYIVHIYDLENQQQMGLKVVRQ